MKTYPYIGKDNYGQIYLMLSGSDALTMDSDGFTHTPMEGGGYKNITREYLQNTYGEVVSPEHAEFIVELAKLHGFTFIGRKSDFTSAKSFMIYEHQIDVYPDDFSSLSNAGRRKQITIPLPPKAEIKKWATDFYELGEPPKHFDCVCNKCGGKCCTGQCDKQELSEWPQVGDKVCWSNGCYSGVVKARHWNDLWVMESDGEFSTLYIDDVKKPKTPVEELRELLHLLWDENNHDFEMFVNVATSHITKKPQ